MDANNQLLALAHRRIGLCRTGIFTLTLAVASTAWAQSGAIGGQSKPTVRHHRVAETAGDAVPQEAIEAEKALDKKDYAQAEKLLNSAVASTPSNYRVWFDQGELYSLTDRKPQAIEAYKKCVAIKPDLFESNLNLGLLLASAGNTGDAAKYLRAATALKPSQADSASEALFTAWDALGHVLEKDSPDDALTAYQKAEELHPKDFDLHLATGRLAQRKNNFDAAEKEYKQALELKPDSAEALAELTDVYIAARRLPEAEQSLRDYLKLNPQSATAHVQLGRILFSGGHNKEALAEFEAAQTIAPQNREAQREIADLAFDAKEYDEAERLYRNLVKDDARNPELHNLLANALMYQKKFPEAQQEFIASLSLDPSRAQAYEGLATVAAENQNYPLVIKALDARAKLQPETPATYFLRASSFDHLHDVKKAAANYHLFLSVANGKYPTQEWQAKHRLIAIEPEK
jgi:tetratricopeptide (TPR) repeat protein